MYNFYNVQTDIANKIINDNAGITDLQFLKSEIDAFLNSKQRKDMINAYNYLIGNHDILKRKRTVIGQNECEEEARHLPNNKIVDNQYAKAVEQKTNYLFAREMTIEATNKEFEEKIKSLFDKRFSRMFRKLGENAINYGIGWLYVYIENDTIKFKNFAPYEILPFWSDEEQTELDMVVRVYYIEQYNKNSKDIVTKVEVYHKDKVDYYIYDTNLTLERSQRYISLENNEKNVSFLTVPVIPFKSSSKEQPLLNRVKSLQDSLNLLKSNFANVMEEDPRLSYLVLKGYGGTDLGEFRHNLATYGILKIDSMDLSGAGLDILNIEVNGENYTTIINMLKKSIIENANAFDVKDERLANNPNQLNIRSMYSDIDLASNGLEIEFQCSLEILFDFFAIFFRIIDNKDFSNEKVNVVFNKDQLLNSSEIINDLATSYEMLSKETILSKHPYVKDVQEELKRLKNEETQLVDIDRYANH